MNDNSFFSLKNVIISLVIFLFFYFLINNSPYGLSQLKEITGGHSILDMEHTTGYSVDRAYEMLDALGEEGRAFYKNHIVPIDYPFPLAYGLFYFITITFLVRQIRPRIKKPWLIGLLGIATGVFDWLENFMIIILLRNYPQRLDNIVNIASPLTQIKSILFLISTLLVVIGLLIIAVRFAYRKAQSS